MAHFQQIDAPPWDLQLEFCLQTDTCWPFKYQKLQRTEFQQAFHYFYYPHLGSAFSVCNQQTTQLKVEKHAFNCFAELWP